VAAVSCAAAGGFYAAIGLWSQRGFGTNAFDLSVFDYALWTSGQGERLAFVPMFGYSLFAQHFMPTLLLLTPFPSIFPSPTYLIVIQAALFSLAGMTLYNLARQRIDERTALALCLAFLFSRRSYSAESSVFYIESAEPLLIFGMVWAQRTRRHACYWVLLLFAIGCKEDVAIYTTCFGVLLARDRETRRIGTATIIVSIAALLFATTIAIPHFRAEYGLGSANPFVEERYGLSGTGEALTLARRIFSRQALTNLTPVIAATGFAALAAPAWLAVAIPGLLLNLAAVPTSAQAGLVGHYLWPILPWVFLAAIEGARRVPTRLRRWGPLLLVLIAVNDTPVPRVLLARPWRVAPDTLLVSAGLSQITARATVTAQPNLIPHLPRRPETQALGAYEPAELTSEYVLLTTVGDLWPFDRAGISSRVGSLNQNPAYRRLANGPLFVYRRVSEVSNTPANLP
jgi:uncharacterized membrane protein